MVFLLRPCVALVAEPDCISTNIMQIGLQFVPDAVQVVPKRSSSAKQQKQHNGN